MYIFLFLFLLNFFNKNFFYYLFYLFLLLLFFKMSWGGLFIISESFFNWGLIFLVFFSIMLVNLIEFSFVVSNLLYFLLVISVYFFTVSNFLLFFLMFELSSMPIILLVFMFGVQIEKLNSIYMMFFYSFLFGYLFLFVLLMELLKNYNLYLVYFYSLSKDYMILMMSIFLVKFPIYFFHFWLPKLHVEASSVASMILAGVLLKLGVEGFTRFLVSNFYYDMSILVYFSMLGLFLSPMVCLMQSDTKLFLAYSSIFHMNLVFFVYENFLSMSKSSGLMMMLSHGFMSVLSFYVVGEFFHSIGSRMLFLMNSIFLSMFFFVFFYISMMLMSSGAPLSLSFFSEFFGLLSILSYMKFTLYLIFFVFFWGFYYSVYMILLGMLGKKNVNVEWMMEILFVFCLLNFCSIWFLMI